jgi:hypothetical protein
MRRVVAGRHRAGSLRLGEEALLVFRQVKRRVGFNQIKNNGNVFPIFFSVIPVFFLLVYILFEKKPLLYKDGKHQQSPWKLV